MHIMQLREFNLTFLPTTVVNPTSNRLSILATATGTCVCERSGKDRVLKNTQDSRASARA